MQWVTLANDLQELEQAKQLLNEQEFQNGRIPKPEIVQDELMIYSLQPLKFSVVEKFQSNGWSCKEGDNGDFFITKPRTRAPLLTTAHLSPLLYYLALFIIVASAVNYFVLFRMYEVVWFKPPFTN
jgi:hypothetical protein